MFASNYLMVFYTKVLGIGGFAVGLLLLGGKSGGGGNRRVIKNNEGTIE